MSQGLRVLVLAPVANEVLTAFERAVSAGYDDLNGNAIVKFYPEKK